MAERRYENREIDNFMKTINDSLAEMGKVAEARDTVIRAEMQSGFSAVNARLDIGNGRTTKLEKWQYTIMGGLSILTIVVVPILGWALYVLVNIDATVHTAVTTAISVYTPQVK